MSARSSPSCLASRRASGDAIMRPPPSAATAVDAGCDGAVGAAAPGVEPGRSSRSTISSAFGADGGASAFGGSALSAPPLGACTEAASSPSSAISPITWLTGTSAEPSGTTILASTPSSTASTSMVALSVSISAMMSPDLIGSPSFFSHLAMLPFSIVGERAGMRMSMAMAASPQR